MKTILPVAAIWLLAGCATTSAGNITYVPVPVECRAKVPDRPLMPTDALQPADSLDRKARALLAEIETREGYELELRAAVETCTAPVKP